LLKQVVVFTGLLGASLWGSTIVPSGGDPETTPGDLFDVASGVTINSNSPVIDACDIRDILDGASNYFLTFNTPAPISLNSYNLYLADDFLDNSANRTVTEFRLYLDDGAGNPVSLLSDVVLLGPGQVNYRSVYGGADDIMLSDTFGEVTGSQFSAVFTSNPLATTGPGPRVFELDGFDTTIPEPSTFGLIALGILGLSSFSRRVSRM
jgi:hypothetical protein